MDTKWFFMIRLFLKGSVYWAVQKGLSPIMTAIKTLKGFLNLFSMSTVEIHGHLSFLVKWLIHFTLKARSSTSATVKCCMETSGIPPLPFLLPLLPVLPLCKPFS